MVVNSPWIIPGRSSGSGGFCAPLQRKTILNSRVLGYGQLKGHVASIVSMFYQKKVLRKEVCLRGTGLWNIVPTRYGAWKAGCCLQGFSAKKSFLNKTLPKPLGYMISTRETMLSLKTFFSREIQI